MARRLLGNLLYQPLDSWPASVAGYPPMQLVAAALNPETVLRLIDLLPPELRHIFVLRSTSTDSAEGAIASYHGALGFIPDAATFKGQAARLDWRVNVQALPVQVRSSAILTMHLVNLAPS
jgi:hypothetical protein